MKKERAKKRIEVSLSRKIFLFINYIVLALVTVIGILPIIHILAISFSSAQAVESGFVSMLPVQFTTSSYSHILGNPNFYRAFGVSVIRVLIGVPVNLILSILVAYPLSKSDDEFRGRKFFVWFFILTMLFNGGLIPTYIIVKSTGLINTIWALILPSAVSVFNILILMNFFRQLPKALEEAALIDGASQPRVLVSIILPLAKPALATITLFIFVYHWNTWFDGLMYINTADKIPLQTYLQGILTIPDTKFMTTEQLEALGKMSRRTSNAAQIVVSTIPILIVYPFLQKYYTKGLVLGSVKS